MKKNKDYTLYVHDVPPASQLVVAHMMQALQENFSTQGFGTATKSAYSPVSEKYIVEFLGFGGIWKSSMNYGTKGEFNTLQEAEAAMDAETDGYEYRAVGINSRVTEEPAEEWIVEYELTRGSGVWSRSSNLDGVFKSRAEAKAAINAYRPDFGYRAQRIIPVQPAEKPAERWIVEFRTGAGWMRSQNNVTNEEFASEAEANQAITKWGATQVLQYRARKIN